MNWFAKFEKKFSKYAIKNLMFYIIVLYAIGFVMNTFFNGLYDAYFSLDFAMIFKGQVWRLITFILQPPSNSIIFVVFVLYFYYLIGSVLERIWGSFRFNVYFFTGVILNILASLIIYLIWGLSFKLSTNYINLALFMAFAMEQPDMEVLLFFIIPIKIKWMAILDAVIFGITIVFGYLVPFLPRNVWYSLYAAGSEKVEEFWSSMFFASGKYLLDILYGMEFSRKYDENLALNNKYEKSGKKLLW